jgi:outer membrane protein TolC
MAQDDEHSMPLESPSGWLPDLSALSPSLNDKLPPAPATGPRAKPDPAKSGGQGLTLGELIELALANNPSTRSEWAQAKAAAAELGQAYSAYYPQASLTYTGSRVRSGEHFLGGGDEYETTWGPTLTISILLADLGGRGATVDEAGQNLTAARYSFQQAVHDLLLSVHEGFFNYYAAIQGVSSARADLEAAQAGLDVAEAQHKVGVGTKSDVLQAQANLAQGQYQLEEALGALRTAWVNLALVTGLPPEPRLKVADPAPADGELAKLTSSQLTELAVKHRPELLALEAQVKAYRSAVRVADSAMWPDMEAGVELEQTEYSDQEGEYQSTAYLELNFDLFTGFSSSYKRKEAVANLWDARGQLAATRLEITNNVLSQQQTYLSSQAQVTSSQAYLSSAEQSYQMALGLYREGLGTIVSVINAQDKLTEARSQLVQAQASLNIAAASLAHACGQAQRLGGK